MIHQIIRRHVLEGGVEQPPRPGAQALGHGRRLTVGSAAGPAQAKLVESTSIAVTYLCVIGDRPQSDELLGLAEAMWSELPDGIPKTHAHGRIEQARALRALFGGSPGDALRHDKTAAGLFAACGNTRLASHLQTGIGFLLAEIGQFRAAQTSLETALATAEELRLGHIAGVARHNLGKVACFLVIP